MNPGLTIGLLAQGAIAPKCIVAAGTVNGSVKQAEDGDKLLGLSDVTGAADTRTCDVILGGIGEVKLGGPVAFGGRITTDDDGLGVACTAAKDSVGIAMASGVAGDIIPVLIERNPAVTPA